MTDSNSDEYSVRRVAFELETGVADVLKEVEEEHSDVPRLNGLNIEEPEQDDVEVEFSDDITAGVFQNETVHAEKSGRDNSIASTAFSFGDGATEAEEAVDELQEQSPDVELNPSFDDEVNEKEVGSVEKSEAIRGTFRRESVPKNGEEDLDEIRKRVLFDQGVEYDETAGYEYGSDLAELQKKFEKFEEINRLLKEAGSRRRYVVKPSDSPKSAYVYEDDFGSFYFKVDDVFRPSDVAAHHNDESWWLYDATQKTAKTISFLADKFPEIVKTADSVESVYTFTDRVFLTADEVVNDEDALSLKQQDSVVSTLVQAHDRADRR